MKKTLMLAAILASSILVALPAPSARADVSVSFSYFQGNLTPYGHWVTVGSYGRCWYPAGVPAGWQPYTVGHWGYGDYGYTWVSADPWGDVTYRYGTWTYAAPYGWVWVPGYTWAPAWVTWSYSPDYIGWAPIPPSFSFAVGGYFGSPVVVSRNWYCFVPKRQFATYDVAAVRVPVRQNSVLLASSRNVTRFPVSNGVVRNTGVPLRNIESVAQTRVERVNASQMRVAPARVEATRTSSGSRRIAVAAPAATAATSVQSRQQVSASKQREAQPSRPERSTSASTSTSTSNSVRRAPAPRNEPARSSTASQPKRQSQPRSQQQSETRQQPSSREQSQAARRPQVSESAPARVQQSRVEPRTDAKATSSSASAARERERARAAEVSQSRPQPSREIAPASRPQSPKQSQVKSQRSAPNTQAKAPAKPKPQPQQQRERKPNESQ